MNTYLEIQVFPMMLDPNPHAGEGDCCLIEEVGQAQFYDGHVMQRDSVTHEMLDTVEEVDNLSRVQIAKWWDEVQEAYPDAGAEWHVDAPMDAATFTLLSALVHQQQAAALITKHHLR